jgi:hypothetical protein
VDLAAVAAELERLHRTGVLARDAAPARRIAALAAACAEGGGDEAWAALTEAHRQVYTLRWSIRELLYGRKQLARVEREPHVGYLVAASSLVADEQRREGQRSVSLAAAIAPGESVIKCQYSSARAQ